MPSTAELFRPVFAYTCSILEPQLIYFGARIIALRLVGQKQVNVRVIITRHAIDDSCDPAHEIFTASF